MEYKYGLIGERLGHSFSPVIHNLIHKELGISGSYELIEVSPSKLEEEINRMKSINTVGLNVTIPYKIDAIKYIDELSVEAEKIGSINTISFKNRTIGYNTDYYGFEALIKFKDISIKNTKAVVLGYGGAARSIIQYLIDSGIGEIIIVSRSQKKKIYNSKLGYINTINYSEVSKLKTHDLLINCTPVGMHPKTDVSPIPLEVVSNYNTVIDLIYNPNKTLLLKYAEDLGLKAANGMYMLTAQAVYSYKYWNEIAVDDTIINKIYYDLLGCDYDEK